MVRTTEHSAGGAGLGSLLGLSFFTNQSSVEHDIVFRKKTEGGWGGGGWEEGHYQDFSLIRLINSLCVLYVCCVASSTGSSVTSASKIPA